MATQRRDFLGWLGGTSLFALGGAPVAFGAHASSAPDHPAAVDDKFDVSWADKVQGRFRAVFDSPEISEGAALFRAMIWCDEYKSVYGTARAEMSPVLVVRHEAIHLAMNDEYWKRFKIGKEVKLKTPEGKKWAEANPIRVTPPGTPEKFSRYNLETFMREGGIVLACGLAFSDVVGKFKDADKLDDVAARQRAIEHMVPGVILQPSGVFAVLRAQEAGCKYMMAS
ncbi:MAG TPA: hypothetical protein VGQ30_02510 [Gemmatimonadaceae bacterium]|jgi:hypothetical protein|nr:hypothetical protein [Gemmatimonadaceae bacterium]